MTWKRFCITGPVWGVSTGDQCFCSQPIMLHFCVFFAVSRNKLLNKQSSCQRIETLCHSWEVAAMKSSLDLQHAFLRFSRKGMPPEITKQTSRNMMTSSNGSIFRVTGPVCEEFTGHRWIPRYKSQWRGALVFSLICAWINGWLNNREAGDLRRHHTHNDDSLKYQWTLFLRVQLTITQHWFRW